MSLMDPIERATARRIRPLRFWLRRGPWKQALPLTRWETALLLIFGLALIALLLAIRAQMAGGPAPALVVPIDSALPPPQVAPQRLMPIAPTDAREVNLHRPFVLGTVVPAAPFRFAGDAESRVRAVDCLAAAGWYEGGDDASLERSAMQVVLNRVRNPAFPASVCGVVFQGSERSTGCQFTFSCDGAMARRPSAAAWERARRLAQAAIGGAVDARVGYATHYHTDWVVPYWSSTLDKIAQIGPHIFYRWRGFWGEPRAFRLRPFVNSEPFIAKLGAISPAHHRPGDPAIVVDPAATLAGGAAQAPLPAPIALAGVREKSLRGALVRGESPDVYFIQLDPARFAGNYATAALAICKDRARCTVLGWIDSAAMTTSLPLAPSAGRQLTFYYHRDGDGERALWNCDQVKRSNPTQCLPSQVGALRGLGA